MAVRGQITLDLDAGPPRCSLCRRPLSRRYCKTCTKGGLGEAPPLGSPMWRRWRDDLTHEARRRLDAAGHSTDTIARALGAAFADRGQMPPEAAVVMRPFMDRLISPRRYQRALDIAACASQLHAHLVGLEYSPDAATTIAHDAARAIVEQRSARSHARSESDLLALAVYRHEARVALGGHAREAEVERLAEQVLATDKTERPRVAIDLLRVEVPGLRVAADGVAAEIEEQAQQESAEDGSGLVREAWE